MIKYTHPQLFAVIYELMILDNCLDTDPQQEARDIVEAVNNFTMSDVHEYLDDLDPECPSDAEAIARVKRAMR